MFNSFIEPFLQFWQHLSERDKKSSVALAASLGLLILIFGIIKPVRQSQIDLDKQLEIAETINLELTALAPNAIQINTSGSTAISSASLNSEIRRQAARYGIAIQRIDPDGEKLKVWLDEARYPSAIQWLGGLEAMGISHVDLTMENKPKLGYITLRATFEASN